MCLNIISFLLPSAISDYCRKKVCNNTHRLFTFITVLFGDIREISGYFHLIVFANSSALIFFYRQIFVNCNFSRHNFLLFCFLPKNPLKKSFFPVSSINLISSRSFLWKNFLVTSIALRRENRQRSDLKNLPTRSTFNSKLNRCCYSPLKTGFVFRRFLFSRRLQRVACERILCR